MKRIIISTPGLYTEIPEDYSTLSINLIPVHKQVEFVTRETVYRMLRGHQPSSLHEDHPELAIGRFTTSDEHQVEEKIDLLYEVQLIWRRYQDSPGSLNSHGRDYAGEHRTHPMSLEDAMKEKALMQRQIIQRHQLTNCFEDFFGDPDGIAVAMLSEKDWEREAACIAHNTLERLKNEYRNVDSADSDDDRSEQAG